MPGIVGIISGKPIDRCQRQVQSMVASMQHEPFYTSGMYAAPEMGIYGGGVTHDHSWARGQVFLNAQRDIALIFSGECFFDSQTLANVTQGRQQIDADHASRLVHLYEEERDGFFRNLNGLFSGLLIDKRERKAFLFNDRYGSERIYWHETDEGFYFASEAKALLRILPELREFDPEGVAQFLAYGCTLNWRTLFRDVNLLPGGSIWTFEGRNLTKRRYFDSRSWESLPALPPDSFKTQFEETFEHILPRYCRSLSKIGISLTGGLDTRMIMACRRVPDQIALSYTFSGLERETLDDRAAASVAKACGLEHHLLRLGADFFSDFASHADRTVYVTDGCFGITGTHEIYLNRQARELAPVRLTGLFGSEILRGISTFKPLGLSPLLFSSDFGPLVRAAGNEFDLGRTHPITAAAFRNVPWNLFASVTASRSQVELRTPYLDNDLVALAFQAPESLRKAPQVSLELIAKNNPTLAHIPTDRRIEYRGARFPRNLKRLFFEATFKLDYLYNEGMPPWLLPFDSVLNTANSRVKIFGHHKFLHYRSWFRNELSSYISNVFANRLIYQNPFWNSDFVRGMAGAHINGKKNYAPEINAVLTLEAIERLLFRELPDTSDSFVGPEILDPSAAGIMQP
jgi:asparagine synthase (glutamine-hydrolysing)